MAGSINGQLDIHIAKGKNSLWIYIYIYIHTHTHICVYIYIYTDVVVVQLFSHVQLFAFPWTAAHQAFLSFTISWSLLKLMYINQWCHPTISSSVVLFSPCLQSFPSSGCFPMSWLFASGDQSTGASALASVLPMKIQSWFPLGLTGLISLQSKGFSRVFSSTTIPNHQFFSTQPFFMVL